MDTLPTHIRFSTPNGLVHGLVIRTYVENGIGGYLVSAFGGQHIRVPYGYVCYNLND